MSTRAPPRRRAGEAATSGGAGLSARSARASRAHQLGQNMLLFALSLLLLVLMVTLTLGIALRVRDNHELQTIADASAYTSAVVNARAYNDAAIINRLEVSYWVAQAADQSLISWTGYARAMLSAGAIGGIIDSFSCNFLAMIPVFMAMYDNTIRNNISDWDRMDMAAGDESRAIQFHIAGLRDEIQNDLFVRLQSERQNQFLARQLVSQSQAEGARVITGGPEKVTTDETMCTTAVYPGSGRGLCRKGTWSDQMLDAAMGSRLHPFLTSRGVVPQVVQNLFNQVNAMGLGINMSATPPTGSGYWGPAGVPTHGNVPATTRAWGDDHGSVSVTFNGPTPGWFGFLLPFNGACPITTTIPVNAHVMSTEMEDTTDDHVISPDMLTGQPNDIPDVHHTMGTCSPWCPGVWVNTYSFYEDSGEGDAYGQPKSYVALERDYRNVHRPWDLFFNFKFDQSASGEKFDNRGEKLIGWFGRGLDISQAAVLSTGMTYYHRKGQRKGTDLWQETPNLLNPYWRATLVPADIDLRGDPDQLASPAPGGADVKTALSGASHRWQLDAYQELYRQGFKGLH